MCRQCFADEVIPLQYASFIVKYSNKYGVDPTLVAAVIMQESRFNPKAQSFAGAQGLMQFMPSTASTMAKETGRWPKYDIFDAETRLNLEQPICATFWACIMVAPRWHFTPITPAPVVLLNMPATRRRLPIIPM